LYKCTVERTRQSKRSGAADSEDLQVHAKADSKQRKRKPADKHPADSLSSADERGKRTKASTTASVEEAETLSTTHTKKGHRKAAGDQTEQDADDSKIDELEKEIRRLTEGCSKLQAKIDAKHGLSSSRSSSSR
jgi:hypothetical protein